MPTQTVGKELKQFLDRELLKFLVCCNIPFSRLDEPAFAVFMSSFKPGYKLPSASTVEEHLFWEEAARVVTKAQRELQQEQLLSLALDGWTDNGRSLYAYTAMTADRRVYLHALKDFSEKKHTAVYLVEKTEKIIVELGHEGIAAVVTDNAANVPKHYWQVS